MSYGFKKNVRCLIGVAFSSHMAKYLEAYYYFKTADL